MARKILENTLKDAYFRIIFQVLVRCITFFLNAFTLRYVNDGVLGVMNVRLLLLESTILFLSREAFRRACMSQTGSHNWPQIINLLWLTVPLSVVVSAVFSIVWIYVLTVPSDDITPHYKIGVFSIAVSCIIEMFSEPLFLVSRVYLFTKFQIAAHSLTILFRSMVFVPWIMYRPDQAVIAFSVAQITANILYSLGHYLYFYYYIKENNKLKKNAEEKKVIYDNCYVDGDQLIKQDIYKDPTKENSDLQIHSLQPKLMRRESILAFDEPFPFSSLSQFLPGLKSEEHWIHPNSAQLTWSFLKQGVLKQLLTEGERYVMTLFSVMSFNQQGIYDVVNNLGSLAARFLFRPVEDSLYFYFGQSIKRDSEVNEQNQSRMKEAAVVLEQTLNCIVSLGFIIIVFGQSYSTLLLFLYGGETLSTGQGPSLLRAHCFSVLLLGINGITECYSFSTMSAEELNKYNYLMAAFSVVFIFISWGLTKLFGGIGFIIANCCNMAARIVHNLIFINSKYKNTVFKPLNGLKPDKYFLMSLLLALCITKFSENFYGRVVHFLIGGLNFLFVAAVWSHQKRHLILMAINKWRDKGK